MLWALAGCVHRAGCLFVCIHFVKHHHIRDSRLTLSWEDFCALVPIAKLDRLVDQWLLSSGAPANLFLLPRCPLVRCPETRLN